MKGTRIFNIKQSSGQGQMETVPAFSTRGNENPLGAEKGWENQR